MGRLLIFGAIIVVVALVLGLVGLLLANRKERATKGLQDSEQRIEELEASTTSQAAALQEIRDLAKAEIDLADGQGDGMWQIVREMADEALREKKS